MRCPEDRDYIFRKPSVFSGGETPPLRICAPIVCPQKPFVTPHPPRSQTRNVSAGTLPLKGKANVRRSFTKMMLSSSTASGPPSPLEKAKLHLASISEKTSSIRRGGVSPPAIPLQTITANLTAITKANTNIGRGGCAPIVCLQKPIAFSGGETPPLPSLCLCTAVVILERRVLRNSVQGDCRDE